MQCDDKPGAKRSVDLTPAGCKEIYRMMRLIRQFELRVISLVNNNEIAGVTHEYIGEEAIAVGVCSALRTTDVITSTHRGHGHIIAKGGDPKRMMAELLGRETGYNRGKGGSMHIADLSLGIYGANGIVAAGVPIAAAAWAAKIRKSDLVAVAFFGDGAVNQGVLHETMNLAASFWPLDDFCLREQPVRGQHTRQLFDRWPRHSGAGSRIWLPRTCTRRNERRGRDGSRSVRGGSGPIRQGLHFAGMQRISLPGPFHSRKSSGPDIPFACGSRELAATRPNRALGEKIGRDASTKLRGT